MDNKLLRFYNQNRYLVWIVILTVIAIISLIHILNNYIEKNDLQENDSNIYTGITKKRDENYTVITQKKLDKDTSNIIKTFINYCNTGNPEQAYKLLSDDCKQLLYPSLESFKEKYYNKIFNTKKLYSCQAMVNHDNYYTYQINFTEDILATR